MAKEQKTAPAAEGAEAGAGKEKKVQKGAAAAREEKKVPWTMERCKKAAGRFESLEEWKAGAPSSFKSASAKGWLKECETHIKSRLAARKAVPQKPLKKSA